ncbi:hypothetical protein BO71DRAFT_449434 [Aspergillus ellipticus CBS 707.79]|uniref:Uncharacterized protein n=1 Tax=Aspergillus ellipticus CBS 707.79 TaxID=1448320 RepID=A0A319DD69_9EURO|nr:hypothetical protein BO71DRAFT_449434 [Aspergillus ellipticus CBS 707.79]
MMRADRVFSLANLSSSSWSPSYQPSSFCARDQLESLIARHGHPTRVSLSSLQELTATSSTYNPPSPQSSVSDTADSLETLTLSQSATQPIPIPIPKPSHISPDKDFPVTPLTGRFDKGYYFAHRDESPERRRDRQTQRKSGRHGHRPHLSSSSRMRSDSSTFYPPVASPSMSPARPASPQPSRVRAQNTSKQMPAFNLGSLPRFHPAVYQSSGSSQPQPSSPRQTRQHAYRTSGSRDNAWQIRELMEGNTLSKTPSGPLSPSPSAPRLDPLLSPGPVTPLLLEEAGGYLASGASNSSEFSSRDHPHSGPAPDLVERLISQENERTRQKARKGLKGF